MVWPMRHIALLFLAFASAALLSCGGGDLTIPTRGDPASIAIVQGSRLTGRVGEQLAEPLVVRVLDGAGGAVQNATVVIDLPAGSADPDTATTDASGLVTSAITMGSQVGETQGSARVIQPEGPEEVRAGFTLVALAASANGLALVSGDNQQGTAGTTLADPLVVQVTDAFGNPIPDQAITWTAEVGGSVSETSTTTDAEGRSSVLRTLGSASGTQTTQAVSEGLAGSPVIFTHTAIAGTPSGVRIVSGNEQTGLPGTTLPQPLVVEVVDASGNPVIGAAVTWVVTAGGGSLDPSTGTTDENGRSSTSWTLGPGIGANSVQAIVSGVGEAAFTATASAGDPDEIRIVSGDGQQGQAGTRLANPLVVVVVDDADNPVPGVTVTWQAQGGSGSVTPRSSNTDGSGRASTSWTLGGGTGEQRVDASAPGAGTVRFEATSTAGSPSALGIVTQPAGRAQVGMPFSRQPVIQVRDASGNPVPAQGVTITAAIANGAGSLIGTTTQATDGNGRATFTNLGITGATGNHRLIFAAPGFTSATSGMVNVRAAETTTRIVSDTPDPSQPGQGVEVVFEVTTSGAAPAGTVRVTASGGGESCSADVSLGRCTIVLNADGNRTLTASFQGGNLFQSSSDNEPHQVITPDQPPTAQDDGYSTARGVPLIVSADQGVLANDSDPDGDPLSASQVSGPAHGSLSLNADGSFTYTPSADFFGQDTFTYQVTAGGLTDTATVTIIVS
jgi:Bacterial Ig domain/Bacterial Ig-like domain (group 1)